MQTEIQKLDDLGADKVSATSGSKDVTINRGDLRDALKDAMRDVSDMWKPMAKNYENAQNKFRMPYGSDQLLIDTAGSFIEEAAPLEAAFIARGMPTNFIADLTAKRDAFDAVVNESDAARLERVGVNAQFPEPVRKCRAAVEDVDPIVKMTYRTNPGKLANGSPPRTSNARRKSEIIKRNAETRKVEDLGMTRQNALRLYVPRDCR